jgi:hypothetical protein
MSAPRGFPTLPRFDRFRSDRDNGALVYHAARGDDLLQDTVLSHASQLMVMEGLAKYAGELAYTPEVQGMIEQVLTRRFEEDVGNDVFAPPNYGPYDDPELAAFYGVDTSMVSNLQTRKENFAEQRARLVAETVRELEPELAGLAQQMERFRREPWGRLGVVEDEAFVHRDPDLTLFRNEDRGWCPIDLPISTSDRTNTLDMYSGQPEHVFPEPHPGWQVDTRNGLWSSLN